jgi:hypothetical protein
LNGILFFQQDASAGISGLADIEDGAWPDAPEETDNFDLTLLPPWLRYILLKDNVLEWGQEGMTNRFWTGLCSQEERYELRDFFIADIPTRELDDPPDSAEEDSFGNDVIVELSTINSEDTKSSIT